MKTFLRKSTSVLLFVLVSLVSVNFFGDAAQIFSDRYEKEMASMLREEQYITNLSSFDDRVFQKHFIKYTPVDEPSTVVLGSSRTALINEEVIGESDVLNSSVNGASIEDIIAIYQVYQEHDKLPDRIVLGVDPWFFNINNGQERWKTLSQYYYRFHGEEERAQSTQRQDTLQRYRELISFSYFQSSIRTLYQRIVKINQPVGSSEKYNRGETKASDGSRVLRESFREASPEEVMAKVHSYIAEDIYSIEGFDHIDVQLWNDFELLIEQMRSQGISVEFFLSPYHPVAFEEVQNYPMVREVEKRVNRFAKNRDIPIHGSYDPDKTGVKQRYFYDAMHCREEGIEKLLSM